MFLIWQIQVFPWNHETDSEVDTDKKDSLYAEKINSMPESDLSLESMLDCESLIVYTSGTTGNPKGVVLNQQQMLADADSICSWHHITNMTKMMCVLSTFRYFLTTAHHLGQCCCSCTST